MKCSFLSILSLVSCLTICHGSDVFAEGKGGSNGGDYLLLLQYANTVPLGSPLTNGVLPPRNAKHYRYEFIRAARSGLRKLRSLLKSGQKFRYSDGTQVVFNENTLRKFSYRINEIQDLQNKRPNQFVLVESITNSRGEPLTAQNYSDGRIELAPQRWDEMRSQNGFEAGLTLQEGIAVHEILGIEQVERSDEYPVSAVVINDPSNSQALTTSTPEPYRCTRPGGWSMDFSFNWKGLRKVEPGKSHGIISTIDYSCLSGVAEFSLGIGNIYSNSEGKSIGISTHFSSKLHQNDFIKNPVMARQIVCAIRELIYPDDLKDVELDQEDQFIDPSGKKVEEYTYTNIDDRERALVYSSYGLQHALAEAFQADQRGDTAAKNAALYNANTAVGEGLLALDEALRLRKTPYLYIKYTQRKLEHYAKVEYPKLLKEYMEKQRLYDEYIKTGEHPDYNWFDKLMEKLSRQEPGAFKPRAPYRPKEPNTDAFSGLKSCGYFNPETSISSEIQE